MTRRKITELQQQIWQLEDDHRKEVQTKRDQIDELAAALEDENIQYEFTVDIPLNLEIAGMPVDSPLGEVSSTVFVEFLGELPQDEPARQAFLERLALDQHGRAGILEAFHDEYLSLEISAKQ